jgi:hypothetical protein
VCIITLTLTLTRIVSSNGVFEAIVDICRLAKDVTALRSINIRSRITPCRGGSQARWVTWLRRGCSSFFQEYQSPLRKACAPS